MTSNNMKISLISICLWIPLMLASQDDAYFQGNFVRNDNATYRETIQTVLLFKAGFELSPPIIQLNTDERLLLSFDDLDMSYKSYKYTLIHCDVYWNPSQLQQIEYLEGYYEDNINEYKYSYNTTTKYINYKLIFPTDYLKIKKSGNYILKVFVDSPDDQNVVITRRFLVYEPLVTVNCRINKAMDLNNRYTHQQVDFKILAPYYNITEVYRDLHVFVMQNGRWDNIIYNIRPRMITGTEYDYTMQRELAFPGGNEFRYLDMKTLKYNTDRMRSLQYQADGYHVYVLTDTPRSQGPYLTESDINGRRLISVNQARDPYTEADYAWVHFLLPYYPVLAEGNLYVSGSFSDWQYTAVNKMTYNFDLKAYEAKILLKQGYYNYAYAFLENRSKVGDITFIEGSHWETENEYAILVYHRIQGEYYDRLIGLGFIGGGM